MYRPPAERAADAARDPLTTFPRWLVAEGHATEADISRIQAEVDAEVLAATDDALAQPQPSPRVEDLWRLLPRRGSLRRALRH